MWFEECPYSRCTCAVEQCQPSNPWAVPKVGILVVKDHMLEWPATHADCIVASCTCEMCKLVSRLLPSRGES
jgi:hypothetical protein